MGLLGVVLQDYAANVGSYLWNVPCAPGAQQYYVTFEYSVASNPATEPSEFFAISREPQSPKDVGTDPVLGRSATLVWIPGYRNGAVIESYVVELRRWETSSRREQHTTGNFTFTGWQSELLYVQGAVSQYVLADLTPYTKYTVRLGAVNVVGPGAWSELVDFRCGLSNKLMHFILKMIRFLLNVMHFTGMIQDGARRAGRVSLACPSYDQQQRCQHDLESPVPQRRPCQQLPARPQAAGF